MLRQLAALAEEQETCFHARVGGGKVTHGSTFAKLSRMSRMSRHACAGMHVQAFVSRHACAGIHAQACMCRHSCAGIRVQACMCRHSCAGIHVQACMCRHACAGIHAQACMCRHSCAGIHVQAFMCRHSCAGMHWQEQRVPQAARSASVVSRPPLFKGSCQHPYNIYMIYVHICIYTHNIYIMHL